MCIYILKTKSNIYIYIFIYYIHCFHICMFVYYLMAVSLHVAELFHFMTSWHFMTL